MGIKIVNINGRIYAKGTPAGSGVAYFFGILCFIGGERLALHERYAMLQSLLNYCFQHADRPNPIQDLLDKGFLSTEFQGSTRLDIKQKYQEAQNELIKP
jgi:hypothetical protein